MSTASSVARTAATVAVAAAIAASRDLTDARSFCSDARAFDTDNLTDNTPIAHDTFDGVPSGEEDIMTYPHHNSTSSRRPMSGCAMSACDIPLRGRVFPWQRVGCGVDHVDQRIESALRDGRHKQGVVEQQLVFVPV